MRDKIFLALLETSAAHANKSREGFQRLNLSDGQPKILYILLWAEGCTQKELAVRCQIRQSTMTVLLEKLEAKNYIYKEKMIVSGGKRAYGIYLTEEGRSMAEKVTSMVNKLEELSFKGFSDKERTTLLSMLGRVSENLRDEN